MSWYLIFFFAIFFSCVGVGFLVEPSSSSASPYTSYNSQCTHPSVDVTAYADFSLASLITIYNCVRRRGFIRYYFSSLLFFSLLFFSLLPRPICISYKAYELYMRPYVIICFVLRFTIRSPAKSLIAWLADAAVFSVYILCSRCSVAAVLLLAFCLGSRFVGQVCRSFMSSE